MAKSFPDFRFVIALLHTIGIVHPSCGKLNRYFTQIWGLIFFITPVIFTSQKVVSIFISSDMSDKATHIRDADTMGLQMVIHAQLYRYSDGIFNVMSHLSSTENSESKAVTATSRRSTRLSTLLYVEFIVLAIFIMVAPIGKAPISFEGTNGTWKIVHGLPMPVWYPVEVSSYSVHALLYALQSLPLWTQLSVYSTFFCAFPTISMHLSTEFRLLSDSMKRCKNGEITTLIQKHQFLLRLVDDLNVAAKSAMGWYVWFAVICMGTTSLEIITIEMGSPQQMTAVLYLISQILALLLCCSVGEIVTAAGEQFFEATVMSPWTEMELKYRKLMITMTAQAGRPIRLKAGSLYNLSLPLYSELLKTWYQLFNVLKNLA